MLGDVDIIFQTSIQIVIAIILVCMYSRFLDFKNKSKWMLVGLSVGFFLVMISMFVLYYNMFLKLIISQTIVFFVLKKISNNRNSEILLTMFIVSTVQLICEMLAMSTDMLSTNFDATGFENNTMYTNVSYHINNLMLATFAYFMPKVFTCKKLAKVSNMAVYILCLIVLFQYILLLAVSYSFVSIAQMGNEYYVICICLYLITNISLILVARLIHTQLQKEVKLALVKKLDKEFEEVEDRLKDDELQVEELKGLIKESIIKYENKIKIDEMLQDKYQSYISNYTDCVILDIILKEFIKKCEEKEILFKINISTSMQNLMKDTDIIKLFSNLLDNAYESTYMNGQGEINLDVKGVQAMTYICVSNNIDHHAPIIDKKIHGYGKKIIKEMVNGNNWMINIDKNDRQYKVEIVL
ncbi:MAG: GHKL domain-containing protein [Erysipelotrichaceae bacterium]